MAQSKKPKTDSNSRKIPKGFEPATKRENLGWMLHLYGLPKVGKTSVVCSAAAVAPPLFIFDFDNRGDYAMQKATDEYGEGKLYRERFQFNPETDEGEVREQHWKALQKGINDLIGMPYKGTVAFDTGTELWQLWTATYLDRVRMKRKKGDQKKEEVKIYPFDYAKANEAWKNMIDRLKDNGWNLIVVDQMKQVYNEEGNATKDWEAAGQKGNKYAADVCLRLTKKIRKGSGERTYKALVEHCGVDGELEGEEIEDPDVETILSLAGILE